MTGVQTCALPISLTAYNLQKSGKRAIACGNIGTPISSLVGKIYDDTIIVAEVSSFQLDRIQNFKPDVSVILNITPDHLYYHGSMENYVEAKWKIFSNQNEKDLLILNADDAATSEILPQVNIKKAFFSMNPVEYGVFNDGGKMILRFPDNNKEEEIMLFDEIHLPGVHNAYNSMAAALAARAFEIRNEDIRDSLASFEGVEHRLEFVRKIDDIEFINDSKATNINATWYALSSYKKPIVWIAGGRGDNNNYSELNELVAKNVKCIVSIGEESEAIFNHFCTMVRCIKSNSLEDAVSQAYHQTEPGDVVLFTPACKSFDMFMNYEHRGEVFKEIVLSL